MMNKKQLIVAWIMGILVAFLFGSLAFTIGSVGQRALVTILIETICTLIVIFVIGGLLLYTLRTKNK